LLETSIWLLLPIPPYPVTPPLAPPPPLQPGKKIHPIVWILVAVAALFFLGIAVLVGTGLFVAHKLKDSVRISTDGNGGKGTIEFKSKEGKVSFGSGSLNLPSWVPNYPGSKPEGSFTTDTPSGSVGMFTFKTNDSPDKVASFYKDAFESAGMTIAQNSSMAMEGHRGNSITGVDKDKDRQITVAVGGDNETSVSVNYTFKK